MQYKTIRIDTHFVVGRMFEFMYASGGRTGRGRLNICPFSAVRIISFNSTYYNIVSLRQAGGLSGFNARKRDTRPGHYLYIHAYIYIYMFVSIISNCNCIMSYNGVTRVY